MVNTNGEELIGKSQEVTMEREMNERDLCIKVRGYMWGTAEVMNVGEVQGRTEQVVSDEEVIFALMHHEWRWWVECLRKWTYLRKILKLCPVVVNEETETSTKPEIYLRFTQRRKKRRNVWRWDRDKFEETTEQVVDKTCLDMVQLIAKLDSADTLPLAPLRVVNLETCVCEA